MAAAHLTVSGLLLLLAGLGEGSPPRKAKRGFDLGQVFLHSDLDLFQAGMHLASHHPSLGYFAGDHLLHQQHLDFFPQSHGSVHQYQSDIPTAIPRNPKKPIYHYTPLPQGTFPAPKSEESYEKHQNSQDSNSAYVMENPSYLFGYRVNDEQQSLDMGRKEKLDGSVLQGVYHVLLPDNRMQIVHYWSDLTGYHPTITYA